MAILSIPTTKNLYCNPLPLDHHVNALQDCPSLLKGRALHAIILKQVGAQMDTLTGNSLMGMYLQFKQTTQARKICKGTPTKTTQPWNILLQCYARQGMPREAMELFNSMEGNQDVFTFASTLKALGSASWLKQGQQVHALSIKLGVDGNVYVGTSLVEFYSKNEEGYHGFEHAWRSFCKIHEKNVVAWNAMISACSRHVRYHHGIVLFNRMLETRISPSRVTLGIVIGMCGKNRQKGLCKQIHGFALKSGFGENVFVGSGIVAMYEKVEEIEFARRVFNEIPYRDLGLYNSLIWGFRRKSLESEAVILFVALLKDGLRPNDVSFAAVLRVCEDVELGRQLHGMAIKCSLGVDIPVCSSLVAMYSRCCMVRNAWKLFEESAYFHLLEDEFFKFPTKSWIEMKGMGIDERVTGMSEMLIRDGIDKSLENFKSFQSLGKCIAAELGFGHQKVGDMVQLGLQSGWNCADINSKGYQNTIQTYFDSNCENNNHRGNSFQKHTKLITKKDFTRIWVTREVNGVNRAGCLDIDMERSSSLSVNRWLKRERKHVVIWTAMIACYAQNGKWRDALKLFYLMQCIGIEGNNYTYSSLLTACAGLGSIAEGKQVHSQIVKLTVHSDVFIMSGLIDMYCKCGSMLDAKRVFDRMTKKDAVTWNAMISGYARLGHAKEALQVFEQMQMDGVKPDSVTFISVLSACRSGGLVMLGWKYFDLLQRVHRLVPSEEHYACMVELLRRFGRRYEAEDFVKDMPSEPGIMVKKALLYVHRNDKSFGKIST